VRQQIDSNPERTQLLDRFIDARLDADARELAGGEPAASRAKRHIEKPARWRQDLSGTIAQRLNLEHQIHHTVSKLCILAFEPLK
jgi:hypothetical protein